MDPGRNKRIRLAWAACGLAGYTMRAEAGRGGRGAGGAPQRVCVAAADPAAMLAGRLDGSHRDKKGLSSPLRSPRPAERARGLIDDQSVFVATAPR